MSMGQRIFYSTATEFPGTGLASDTAFQIGPGPVRLFQIGGYNPTITDYYVFLFNAVSVNVGDSGFQQFKVPAGASFSWDPSLEGLKLDTALMYQISNDPGALTSLGGATLFLFAQYVDLNP